MPATIATTAAAAIAADLDAIDDECDRIMRACELLAVMAESFGHHYPAVNAWGALLDCAADLRAQVERHTEREAEEAAKARGRMLGVIYGR